MRLSFAESIDPPLVHALTVDPARGLRREVLVGDQVVTELLDGGALGAKGPDPRDDHVRLQHGALYRSTIRVTTGDDIFSPLGFRLEKAA